MDASFYRPGPLAWQPLAPAGAVPHGWCARPHCCPCVRPPRLARQLRLRQGRPRKLLT